MNMPGGMEWLIIIIAILILFGGKKIPEFMRGLGKGVKEFKTAKDDITRDFHESVKPGTEKST